MRNANKIVVQFRLSDLRGIVIGLDAGVFGATVPRVINGIRNVDRRLHERDRHELDRHELDRHELDQTGHVPNRPAGSLVTRRTGTVALVVSADHDPQPLEAMAAESARLLLAWVEDRSMRVSSVIDEPTLVVRESA